MMPLTSERGLECHGCNTPPPRPPPFQYLPLANRFCCCFCRRRRRLLQPHLLLVLLPCERVSGVFDVSHKLQRSVRPRRQASLKYGAVLMLFVP